MPGTASINGQQRLFCIVFICEKFIDVVELNTGCIKLKENSTHSPSPIYYLFIYYATGAAHKKTHIKETYTIKAYTIKRKPTNMRLTKP